jgi:hypothetical protein
MSWKVTVGLFVVLFVLPRVAWQIARLIHWYIQPSTVGLLDVEPEDTKFRISEL